MPRPVDRHTLLEDLQALLTGTLLISLGIAMFNHAGLLTGGTAGLAFYWVAWRDMGRRFTFKTFIAVALLSTLTELQALALHFDSLQPLYAAVMGGLLMGSGFLMLIRHHDSLGGVGIVALALQQERGWRAGKVQMAVDVGILLAALFVVDAQHIGSSLVGALTLNLTLAVNRAPGRYLAM